MRVGRTSDVSSSRRGELESIAPPPVNFFNGLRKISDELCSMGSSSSRRSVVLLLRAGLLQSEFWWLVNFGYFVQMLQPIASVVQKWVNQYEKRYIIVGPRTAYSFPNKRVFPSAAPSSLMDSYCALN